MSAHVLRSSRLLLVAASASSAAGPSSSSAAAPTLVRAFSASPASLLPPKKAAAPPRPGGRKTSKKDRNRVFVKTQRKGGFGNFSFDKTLIPHTEDADVQLFTDLPSFTPENLTPENVGEKLSMDADLVANIKTWGYPSGQEGVAFTVPRKLTLELIQRLEEGKHTTSEDSTWVLNGSAGSGKSQLLLQTVAWALQSEYIVMYIPRADRHTNSRSSYHYNSETQIFHQPSLSSALLERLVKCGSNRSKLAKVPLAKDYSYTPDLPPGTGGKSNAPVTISTVGLKGRQNTILELAEAGAANPDISVAVFADVLDILARQSAVPFFLAMDMAQAYFTQSEYLTPETQTLESYHLSVPRALLEYISGRKQFVRGSILLSLSASCTTPCISRSLLEGLELRALPGTPQAGSGNYSPRFFPLAPTEALSRWHVENARALEVVDVPEGMEMGEAKGLWGFGKNMRITNSDESFVSKYIEAGGNPREFFRALKYTTA